MITPLLVLLAIAGFGIAFAYALSSLAVYESSDEEDAYRSAALDTAWMPGYRIFELAPESAELLKRKNFEYQKRVSQISDRKWRTAHQVWVNHNWQEIANGEKEYANRQRERRLKRAIVGDNPIRRN